MLTAEDIKNLTEYQKEAFRDVFATKEDAKEIKDQISVIQTTLDAVILDNKNINDKNKVLDYRMENTENWIKKAAPKVGVEFNQ